MDKEQLVEFLREQQKVFERVADELPGDIDAAWQQGHAQGLALGFRMAADYVEKMR